MRGRTAVLYWDTSALLSTLFHDTNSDDAQRWARRQGVHLISTLAWAEAHAVIARVERERALARAQVNTAREALAHGPWRHTNVTPDWAEVQGLSSKWPLRGADLWHLAAAKNLKPALPELRILSYDVRLSEAAKGEGLGVRRG